MPKQGKKYKAALAKVDLDKLYSPEAGVALAKETAYTKFDASVEVHMRTALDPRQSDQLYLIALGSFQSHRFHHCSSDTFLDQPRSDLLH